MHDSPHKHPPTYTIHNITIPVNAAPAEFQGCFVLGFVGLSPCRVGALRVMTRFGHDEHTQLTCSPPRVRTQSSFPIFHRTPSVSRLFILFSAFVFGGVLVSFTSAQDKNEDKKDAKKADVKPTEDEQALIDLTNE